MRTPFSRDLSIPTGGVQNIWRTTRERRRASGREISSHPEAKWRAFYVDPARMSQVI